LTIGRERDGAWTHQTGRNHDRVLGVGLGAQLADETSLLLTDEQIAGGVRGQVRGEGNATRQHAGLSARLHAQQDAPSINHREVPIRQEE
jgi:hypothetical protein